MWVRIPLETYIFILNFSLPPGSEQVNGAVANEIKHVHSPEVIVVFRPQIQLIIQGFVYSYLQYSFKHIPNAFRIAGSAVPREGFDLSVIILASLLVFPMLGCRHSLLRL